MNLVLDSSIFQILWWGIKGLKLRNVRDPLVHLSEILPSPDVFIIRDLGKVKIWDLLCEIKRDLY